MKRHFLQTLGISLILIFLLSLSCRSQKVINDGYGDYVFIPAGPFEMGDNFKEGRSDEMPVHTVYLDVYYIGKYEVTNGEYKKFIDEGGYTNLSYWNAGGFGGYGSEPYYWNDPDFKGGGIQGNENFPVVGINWYEACAYCSWLSAKTKKAYRLPTEAEWEKAARGTDQRKYPWGDNIDESYANYWFSGDPYDNGPTPVGFYEGIKHKGFKTHNSASPFGAYDMAGNVSEICYDWHEWEYYSLSSAENPTGPINGTHHVTRGGSWADCTFYLRSSDRFRHYLPTGKDTIFLCGWIGFRCVREN
jgi:formylglycine-generating enzyme required for sulfatase activity